MRFGAFFLFAFLLCTTGFAGPARLPHCRFLDIKIPEECRSQIPPDDLALILPVVDRVVRNKQIADIQNYSRKRMTDQLDESIKARKILLSCMDKPGDKDCAVRVKTLQSALEENLKRFRIVRALAQVPMNLEDHSISGELQMPFALGSAPLPHLDDQELAFARKFQSSALAALESVGIDRLRQELNITLSESALREKCRVQDPDYLEACARISGLHLETFNRFRMSMSKIGDSMISRLPLTLRFQKVPITDDDLRRELAFSQKTLESWRAQAAVAGGKGDYERIVNEPAFADEYVKDHPEACVAAESEIKWVRGVKTTMGLVETTRDITLFGVLCYVSTPLVCFSAGTVAGGLGVTQKYNEWQLSKNRLSSADDENPQASLAAVQGKFSDFLVVTAMTAVGTAMGIKGTFLNGDDAVKAAAIQLESQSGNYSSDAGASFQKLTEAFYGGVKGTTIYQAVQQSAVEISKKEPTTNYIDWIKSDAFTARVFEVFATTYAHR